MVTTTPQTMGRHVCQGPNLHLGCLQPSYDRVPRLLASSPHPGTCPPLGLGASPTPHITPSPTVMVAQHKAKD